MRQNYPNFRRAQREGGPYRKGQPPRRKPGSFLKTVLVLSGIAFIVTWQATPVVQGLYQHVTMTPEEIAAVEQSTYYSGCNDARARGAAPIYRGQPGYREGMDGDGDGVACEPYRH